MAVVTHVPPFRHGAVTVAHVPMVCEQVEPVKPAWQTQVNEALLFTQATVLLAMHGWARQGLISVAHVGPV